MNFRKTIYKNKIVFHIDQDFIDDNLTEKITSNIEQNKIIGIDMKNIQSINSPLLIKYLLEDKIKLFNLQSELLSYLALTLKDGFLKSYVNYSDFNSNKRELIRRRFLVA